MCRLLKYYLVTLAMLFIYLINGGYVALTRGLGFTIEFVTIALLGILAGMVLGGVLHRERWAFPLNLLLFTIILTHWLHLLDLFSLVSLAAVAAGATGYITAMGHLCPEPKKVEKIPKVKVYEQKKPAKKPAKKMTKKAAPKKKAKKSTAKKPKKAPKKKKVTRKKKK